MERRLTQMLRRLVARGLLHARGPRRPDATPSVAAVRDLNRLALVGAPLPHAVHALAQVAPRWLRAHVTAAGVRRDGQRCAAARLPQGQRDRPPRAETMGPDGVHRLTPLDGATAPAACRAFPAVETLRQGWLQHYDQAHGVVRWRDAKHGPPASLRLASP